MTPAAQTPTAAEIPAARALVGFRVIKKSGKPFKSGAKTAVVKGLVEREVPSAPDANGERHPKRVVAYEFHGEPEGYVVNACMCEKAEELQ